MPEVIEHNLNGWLFDDPDDLDAFEQCCRLAMKAFRDDDVWRTIMQRAYKAVDDWDAVASCDYMPVYSELVRRS